jgi:hypothetical protein
LEIASPEGGLLEGRVLLEDCQKVTLNRDDVRGEKVCYRGGTVEEREGLLEDPRARRGGLLERGRLLEREGLLKRKKDILKNRNTYLNLSNKFMSSEDVIEAKKI